MLNKEEKMKFVEDAKKALKSYSTIGVVPLSGIPDRLLHEALLIDLLTCRVKK